MKKTVLFDLPAVYAVGIVSVDGRPCVLAASENRGGAAYLFDPDTHSTDLIWNGPGGVMAMVGAEENTFLSIDNFYPVFDSADAGIYRTVISGSVGARSFEKEKLLDLPWCHRIAYVRQKSGTYIIAGTLCKHKAFVEDWSTKGSVYAIRYEQGAVQEVQCILEEGILKHHAMWVHDNGDGTDDIYVGGHEGTFRVFMQDGAWKTEHIIAVPTSDITVNDFDGDGADELAIIEGFHGDVMRVYKKHDGVWSDVYHTSLEFGHVLYSGQIEGLMSIVLGARGGDKSLRIIRSQGSSYEERTIDEGSAPAQIVDVGTRLYVAEHGMNRIAEYWFD